MLEHPTIEEMHAALDLAGVPQQFRRFQGKTWLTHNWYGIDELEAWRTEQLKMADDALADMTERCRTAETRAWAAATEAREKDMEAVGMNHDRMMGLMWGLLAGAIIAAAALFHSPELGLLVIIPVVGNYLFRNVH